MLQLARVARADQVQRDARGRHAEPRDERPARCVVRDLCSRPDQQLVSQDLQGLKGDALKEAVERGAVILSVCGGYQLLGKYYRPFDADDLPGIGLFDAHTDAGDKRYIRRDEQGRIKESDDVSRSLSQDRRKAAKDKAKPGQGDRGDRK